MSILLNGIPEPRIVLYKDGRLVDDFRLHGFEGGDNAPQYLDFEPDFIRHELQSSRLVSKLRGFRMKVELFWRYVDASQIQRLKNLLDRRSYDTAYLYPYATEKPFFKEEITIDDDNILLAYHYLVAQRDFTLRLMSARLVDYVPLEDPDFVNWGNITLRFLDLDQNFESYMRRLQITTGGQITASTAGYWFDGVATEVVGASLDINGGNLSGFTDIMTLWSFRIPDDQLQNFVGWKVNEQPAGANQELNLMILEHTTVAAEFS